MNILELKGIKHFYNSKMVLDIPDLSIRKGSIYGLVGPNGSGKTTLLSIMSLILKPTGGYVFFSGEPVTYEGNVYKTMLRKLTLVIQNPYLFSMSVADNIGYGLRARGISKREIEMRIKNALELVGLKGFEKRGAHCLSGGEIQLAALARAFVLEPTILFLDEPTANIDVRHINQLEEIVLKINKELQTTIVMTTHNLSQAYHLTETVFSLFEGSLVPSTIHNLFSGSIHTTWDGTFFENRKIKIWLTSDRLPSHTAHITIDPEDIIVSKESFKSSARNLFYGTITKVLEQGEKVFLEVKSNETFRISITKHSLLEIGLNVGSKVYLTFKASSVHLL